MKTLKHLENLDLWQCRQLQDQDLQWMAGKKLVKVDVSYCTRLTDQSFFALTGVEDLSLDGLNYISKEGLSILFQSNRLKKVSLCRCRLITEEAISALAFKGKIQFQLPLLSLTEKLPTWGAITLSSLAFGAAHIPNAQRIERSQRWRYYTFSLPFITSLGAYMGWLTHKNRSLKESVALHAWYDFVVMTAGALASTAAIGEKTQIYHCWEF